MNSRKKPECVKIKSDCCQSLPSAREKTGNKNKLQLKFYVCLLVLDSQTNFGHILTCPELFFFLIHEPFHFAILNI